MERRALDELWARGLMHPTTMCFNDGLSVIAVGLTSTAAASQPRWERQRPNAEARAHGIPVLHATDADRPTGRNERGWQSASMVAGH